VNRSRSHLRHLSVVRRHAEREALPAHEAGADHAAYDVERRGTLLDALRGLPRRQREVLALRYYLDLSEAEIADVLGISRGAVKSHASRGAAALRAVLGPSLEETR
jgi:RNA polymerase sigma factor (sigma-70 family)